MAEEDHALEGDGAQVIDAPQQDDTPEPIANLARDLGWTPKDEWQGEPDKWKPAEQFIRDGRDIQQSTARELRSVREQMERIGGVTESIVQERVAAARAQWEQQVEQATEEGDTKRVLELARAEPRPASNGPDPSVSSWVAKNEWFNKDPLAQARAKEISQALAHLPVAEQLAQVERGIRKEFPELFPAPAKQPPATQTGSSRAAAPGNRVKGWADMPAASQQALSKMIERHPSMTKESVAKAYWADPANQKRA